MSVMIEQDLKEYLDQKFSNFERRFEEKFDKIDERLDKIDQKLERIEKDVTDLKIGQARLEEKIEGLDKRLGFQEFINRGVLIGFILAILGGLAKLFGLIGNP
jgi:K+/H+ antiporter YhaU regulatory subunit KhtT